MFYFFNTQNSDNDNPALKEGNRQNKISHREEFFCSEQFRESGIRTYDDKHCMAQKSTGTCTVPYLYYTAGGLA